MRLATTYFILLLTSFICLSPGTASAAGLSLELNKIERGTESCIATIQIANRLGQSLDRFRLDLVLFDSKGVIFERLLIDLAPLPHDRTTIASFPLLAAKCSDVSRILVKDVPACRAEGGGDMDCFSSLRVKTRARIKIGK